jgi:single-strand DNA-binding protein
MAGVQKILLIGNLGGDAEIFTFENGDKKASFSIAVTESYKDKQGNKQENVEWFNCVCFRGLAGVAEKYLKKGNTVYIEGKQRTRKYQDKDGNNRVQQEIYVDNLNMLGGKRDNSQNNNNDNSGEPDDLPY